MLGTWDTEANGKRPAAGGQTHTHNSAVSLTADSPGVCREDRREESSWEGFVEEVTLGLRR